MARGHVRGTALAAMLTLTLAPLGFGEPSPNKGGPPPSDLSVTTEIQNVDANGQVCTILSDGPNPYTNTGGVVSILTANVCNGLTWGDWRFNVGGSSRMVGETYLSTDAIQPGDPHYRAPVDPNYPTSQSLQPWMNVQCTCRTGKSMYTMAPGDPPITCPLLNNWYDAAGAQWILSAGKSFTGYPETTDAQITCNAASDGHCVDWYIEPIDIQRPGGNDDEAVGRLVGPASCKKCTDTNKGDYYMRFRIHVSLP